jgi:hypothetical protein
MNFAVESLARREVRKEKQDADQIQNRNEQPVAAE